MVDVALGPVDEEEGIIFEERARKGSEEVQISTDDGSQGRRWDGGGVEEMLAKRSYRQVLACGRKGAVVTLSEWSQKDCGVESQMSLERYMKCGSRLCG